MRMGFDKRAWMGAFGVAVAVVMTAGAAGAQEPVPAPAPRPTPPPARPPAPPPAAPPPAAPAQPYYPQPYPPPVYYAPQPYYPPPPYGPPQYGPPQYGPPQYGPPPPYPAYRPKEEGPPQVVYGWDPDRPAPDGYRMVSTPNGRLIGVGIALFSSGYVTAIVSAAVAGKVEEDEALDDADGVLPEDWNMLYIPVAGPFITIRTVDASPSGTGLLIADGILQTGGVLSFIIGLVDRDYKVVRDDRSDVGVVPSAPGASAGLSAVGSF
jgi:hypothetical protein